MAFKVFSFRSCCVSIHADLIVTHFREDGSRVHFAPPASAPDFMAGAALVGFSGLAWPHGVQHELAHHLLADAMGLRHSLSVWNVAHGLEGDPAQSEAVAYEEHLAVALQKLANRDLDDDVLSYAVGHARYQLAALLADMTQEALE